MPISDGFGLFGSPGVDEPDKEDYYLDGDKNAAGDYAGGRARWGLEGQDREGQQIDRTQIDQSRALGMSGRQDMRDFSSSTLDSIIRGDGPSAASQQLYAGQDSAMAQSLALARSGRGGGGGAGALRAAQAQNALTNQQTNQAAAVARSQEQLGAINAKQQLLTNQRAMDLQAQGLDAQTAIAQAQIEAAQRAQNDQYQLGMLQSGNELMLGQMGAMGNYNATKAQAQGANAAADASRDAAMLGMVGSLGAAGIVAGGSSQPTQPNQPPQTSDVRAKTDISPLAMLDPNRTIYRNVARPFRQAVDAQIYPGEAAPRGATGRASGREVGAPPLQPHYETTDPRDGVEAERARREWYKKNDQARDNDMAAQATQLIEADKAERAAAARYEAERKLTEDYLAARDARGARNTAIMQGDPVLQSMPEQTSDEQSKTRIRELEAALAGRSGSYPTPQQPNTEALDAAYQGQARPAVQEMASLPSYSYRYKEPWASQYGAGEQVGPMADDLEKSPLTAASVHTGADGYKAVDPGRLTMTNTAVLGELSREVEDIRRQLGGPDAITRSGGPYPGGRR